MKMRPLRCGVTFIEILVAMAILAGLGITIQSLMVTTVQGIGIDKVTEAKRQMVLDLLERFGHPYSDIEALFKRPGSAPVVAGKAAFATLTLDEAIALIAIPDKQAAITKATLVAGGTTGFTVSWTKAVEPGAGDPDLALRLDELWVFPVQSADVRGSFVSSFRVFSTRGQ
jgi:prepilin-type N-terminal cleavage/methylation domain-containing protein